MKMEYIQFCKPYLTEEDVQEAVDTLRSGWIGTGPKTKLFEDEFSRFIGARHSVALNSCTAGLHLALHCIDAGAGDEVITPPMTFCATANVVVHLKAKPVFADVCPDTFNIAPEQIAQRITPRTKAVIVVHMTGHPCQMDEISGITRKYNIKLIEDAAHALESWYKDKKVGNIGDFSAFSFYATKNITTGEGGMLTTNNDEYAERVRILSLHGMSKDAWKRYLVKGIASHFTILEAGYKYNMCDIQASLGLSQLRRIDKIHNQRKRIFQMYTDGLKDVPEITLQSFHQDIKHAYHLFIILLNLEMLTIDRDKFRTLLEEHNIGTGVHFVALHLHPFYRQKFGYKPGDYPVAEDIGRRTISLPLYLGLSDEQIYYIIDVVKELVKRHRR